MPIIRVYDAGIPASDARFGGFSAGWTDPCLSAGPTAS